MFDELFEITEDDGRYLIAPVKPEDRGRYLIECRSKAEAAQIVLQAKSPLSAPDIFKEKERLPSGTVIFVRS